MISYSSSAPTRQSQIIADSASFADLNRTQPESNTFRAGRLGLGQDAPVTVDGPMLNHQPYLLGSEAFLKVPSRHSIPLPPTSEDLLAGRDTGPYPTPGSALPPALASKLNGMPRLRRTATGASKPIAPTVGAKGMIRSYSVPVATQREYDQQRRAFAEQEADEPQSPCGWPASTDCLGAAVFKRRLHRANSGQVTLPSLSPGPSNLGPRSPRSPLSPLSPMTPPLSPVNRAFSSSSLRSPMYLPQSPTSHLAVQVFDFSDDEEDNSSDEDDGANDDGLEAVKEGSEADDTPTSGVPNLRCEQEVVGCYFASRRPSCVTVGLATPKVSSIVQQGNALGFTPLPTPGMEHSFSSRFKAREEVVAGVWVGGKGGKQETWDNNNINGLDDWIHPCHLVPPPALAS